MPNAERRGRCHPLAGRSGRAADRHRGRLRRRVGGGEIAGPAPGDRKSTRLNSSHSQISYAVFCLKKKPSMSNSCFLSVLVHRKDEDMTSTDNTTLVRMLYYAFNNHQSDTAWFYNAAAITADDLDE